jgi:asparaginyl-tRNA synthetase
MINKFFFDNNVIKTDPNIITLSDCEGAGETFAIKPSMFSKDSNGEHQNVGLTVSSQLPLEATSKGFSKVFTMQKSFRAERSDTSKHLAEFLHVEYEEYFTTLDKLLTFTENYLKTIIYDTYNSCKKDFDFLNTKFAPKETNGKINYVLEIIKKPFVRITHKDAVDLIISLVKNKEKIIDETGKTKRVKVKELPNYFSDLSSEHEKIIVNYYQSFVYITHWPMSIKSFYMKQCKPEIIDDKEYITCESFDLLSPFVGEIFGGSMREFRYDVLINEIKKRDMNISPIQWYLDIRKEGTAPHGGWGMGFARILMLITGVESVRDIVPFPVYYGHCPY